MRRHDAHVTSLYYDVRLCMYTYRYTDSEIEGRTMSKLKSIISSSCTEFNCWEQMPQGDIITSIYMAIIPIAKTSFQHKINQNTTIIRRHAFTSTRRLEDVFSRRRQKTSFQPKVGANKTSSRRCEDVVCYMVTIYVYDYIINYDWRTLTYLHGMYSHFFSLPIHKNEICHIHRLMQERRNFMGLLPDT